MHDLETQLRAWSDAANNDAAPPLTVEQILRRTTGTTVTSLAHSPTRRRGRSMLLAAASIAFIAGGAALLWPDGSPTDSLTVATDSENSTEEPTTAAPAESVDAPSQDWWQLHYVNLTRATAPSIHSATSPDEFAELTNDFYVPVDADLIDFERSTVVMLTIADDQCNTDLERFDENGSTITAVFRTVEPRCPDAGRTTSFVVAVDQQRFGDTFTVRMVDDAGGTLAEALVRRPTSIQPDGMVRTMNAAETFLHTAVKQLGLESCCEEDSHGGSGATRGLVLDGVDVPIGAHPIDPATGAALEFGEPVSDVTTSSIAGHNVTVGSVNGSAFAVFECNGFVVRVGGPWIEAGQPSRLLVDKLSSQMIPILECAPAEAPTVTGLDSPNAG